MLDLMGSISAMSAVGICLVVFLQALPVTKPRRLALTAIAGGWVGLATGLGAAGLLTFSPEQPVPLLGVLFAVPLLVVGVLALRSQSVRGALLAVPLPALIGLNSLRVLGVIFLLLAASGRLSGPFPYFAGIGDIVTGAVAIPFALGIASSNGSPVQLIHAATRTAAELARA